MQPLAALSKIFSYFLKRAKYLQNGVQLRYGTILDSKKTIGLKYPKDEKFVGLIFMDIPTTNQQLEFSHPGKSTR